MASQNMSFINKGPGEFIKEKLENRNWRQEDLADILGMSLKSVNKLIKNKQAITIETARLLSKALGMPPQNWINLDANFRLRLQRDSAKEKLAEIKAKIYTIMPMKEIVDKGWLSQPDTYSNLLCQFKKFWNIDKLDISNLEDEFLKIHRKFEGSRKYTNYDLTWLQMAYKCARNYHVAQYNDHKLEILTGALSKYTYLKDGVELFLNELEKIGVKFFVLSHLQNTNIDGATFFDKQNPVVVYTGRRNRIDDFWLIIAHEIDHILFHLKEKNDFFIDTIDGPQTPKEKMVNRFVLKTFKAKKILNYFRTVKKISRIRVNKCARELELNPAIVVRILQYYNKHSYRNLTKFRDNIFNYIPKKNIVCDRV